MFEHKHAITRFFVSLWLLCLPTLVIGGMWGIFVGMVLIVAIKAGERAMKAPRE